MLDYVYGHDEIVSRFVAQLIPECRDQGLPAKASTIGIVDEDGSLIAGLVYYNYSPRAGTIEMSAAALPGTNWFTRETIKRMYQYPFHTCDCQMVVMVTAADNDIVQRILASLGHMFIRIPRLMGRDRDAIVCLLTREAWAKNKICQRYLHHIPDDFKREAA